MAHSAPEPREPIRQPESRVVTSEPLSPELVLVDPDLAARARAALPMPAIGASPPLRAHTAHPAVAAPATRRPAAPAHPYPVWARVTAALWLVVIGILIGGAAIPHAQDTPHLIPQGGEPSVCRPETTPVVPPTVTQRGR